MPDTISVNVVRNLGSVYDGKTNIGELLDDFCNLARSFGCCVEDESQDSKSRRETLVCQLLQWPIQQIM